MTKAEIVNLITKPRLTNELYFKYILDVNKLIRTSGIDRSIFGGEDQRLEALCNELDEVLEQVKLSEYTAKIEKKDAKRENTYSIMLGEVKLAMKDEDNEETLEAAITLFHVFKAYGNIKRKSYDEETASIYNLVQDFENKYSEQIEILELQSLVAKLKTLNTEFDKLMGLRNTEKSLKPKARAVDIRKEINQCYGNIVKCIEVKTILNPNNHGLTPFINELNTNIDRYRNVLAVKAGKKKAAKNND